MAKSTLLTYLSLFSSAGIGCYGFKLEGFKCVATVELLEKRMRYQRFNEKCPCATGYISDDMTSGSTKGKIFAELRRWNIGKGAEELDVLISTPPCQGMSVANHKKRNELGRNSLVVESITLTHAIAPRFFIFENVRAFLTTACTDVDGVDKPIREAIESNLGGLYHIGYQVLNFKNYGNPSSRTRTLVIGTRKDLRNITPLDILPSPAPAHTLREVIGHLPPLTQMGEISDADIYHGYRPFDARMLDWISAIGQGGSAFDNREPQRLPHKLVNGEIVINIHKNGDKYTRQRWDRVAPCIHTRNDILASQNTIHPTDNRVFSIRELMLMMSIPDSFRWSDKSIDDLNRLTATEKKKFLKREELSIRHSIGEAVPTVIFQKMAQCIRRCLINEGNYSDQYLKNLIETHDLMTQEKLADFLEAHLTVYPNPILSKIAELANTAKGETAAYYTRQDICYSIVKDLPDASKLTEVRILEPAIGAGNFMPLLIEKYRSVKKVTIDVVDIDANSLRIFKILLKGLPIPGHFNIGFIAADFLTYKFREKYDVVIGNPPFMKVTDKGLLKLYRGQAQNKESSNLFAFFIEKSLKLADQIALIVPKSLLGAPEFNQTRQLIGNFAITKITDYGEKAFKGVKIETISIMLSAKKNKKADHQVAIESYIENKTTFKPQHYIISEDYPYWLIYRDALFDQVAARLKFNVFKSIRDRQITKKITKDAGKVRVLKSRNIGSNTILDITGYDSYVDEVAQLSIARYMNIENAVLVPNLTYYPRACFMPPNTITDGSVAILTLRNGSRSVNESDLAYYNSEEFSRFYAVARNYGTRSLNIDNNSVFFFGILKDN